MCVLQSVEKYGVIDRVKGGREVQERQNRKHCQSQDQSVFVGVTSRVLLTEKRPLAYLLRAASTLLWHRLKKT